MPVHRSITFRVPNTLEEVYEAVLRPKDFFSLLPLSVEFKSFRGSDVVIHMDAFGFKGDAVFSYVITKGTSRFTLESSMIGEIILGFFRPPRMDLTFRMTATKVEGGTEISFEVYVRSSALRERLSGIVNETERFISRIPKSVSEALKGVSTKPIMAQRETAEPPKLAEVSSPEEKLRATEVIGAEKKEEEKRVAEPSVPEAPKGVSISSGIVPKPVSDLYSNLLEDPIAVYKLTTQGKSITTFRMKYSSSLMEALSNISTKNKSPIYAVLKGEKHTARLLMEDNNILGILLELGDKSLKGEKALEILEKSEEELVCAVFAVSKDILELIKQS
ncbi:MAG: hypothetical protein QW741_00410 [Sulfolobales archaeon]